MPTPEIRGLRPRRKPMSETNASGAQVPCISLLADLSRELDRWRGSAIRDAPDSTVNRATINAVGVIADALAITLALHEARQRDAARTANATLTLRGGPEKHHA
jgi:hypothetical protein